MLTELDTNNFENEIKTGLKLVEFYTDWCGYCKKQKPELEELNKVWIGQVEADRNPQIAAKYNVNAFPTFLIFKNGKDVERFSGFRKKEDLMQRIMKHLQN